MAGFGDLRCVRPNREELGISQGGGPKSARNAEQMGSTLATRRGRVPRLRGGSIASEFRILFNAVRSNPATQRQIWVVLGGGLLSRAVLEQEFKRPKFKPHVLQFYHLVLSTYASCQSVGAGLRIFCAD